MDPKPKSATYTLEWPIAFGSETVTQLTLRRPKGKDLRAVTGVGDTTGETLDLIGRLSGQPRAVIDEMDADDVAEAGKIIAGFSRSGRKTGDESAPS